jgi:hypothetical protein
MSGYPCPCGKCDCPDFAAHINQKYDREEQRKASPAGFVQGGDAARASSHRKTKVRALTPKGKFL